MQLIRTTTAALGTLLLVLGTSLGCVQAAPATELRPCELEHPAGLTAVSAECGSLAVPEDPANSGGRRINLRIARIPAVNRRKLSDPLVVLAGGPGQAAIDFYVGSEPAFARIRRDRDILLVDQRGTGGSNRLNCDQLDEDAGLEVDEAAIERETLQCAGELGRRADLRFYTTSIAVSDLEQVRAALGYERLNLYGVSYGTRVAQHYLRRFPQRVRSMILDGVVPVRQALGPAMAIDAENALLQIFERCSRDAACRDAFGNPADDYRVLRASVSKAPVAVTLPDPHTGVDRAISFSMLQLATVLRISSYNTTQAALLPLSLHLARRDGNFKPLAAQYLAIADSLKGQIAYGMHNSVVCAEDVPFYAPATINRDALAKTYLGTSQIDGLLIACRVWPRGSVDPDFHAQLRSPVPALILSGEDDPATPRANGSEAMRSYPNGLHVIVPEQGHGQLAAPCVDSIMARFIDSATTRELNVSCVQQARAFPFFTTTAGPAP